MNLKQRILNNAFTLNEMAAAELAKVVDLIKAGDLKGAAAKYIEVGGNPSSSGVGKTVNSYIAKHAELSPEEKQHFEGFKSAVEEIKGEKGIKSNRPTEYKTGVTGVTRKGEEVTVKGLSQQARKENVLKVIDKQKLEIDKERAMLDAGNDEAGLRKMAMEFVKDMKYTDLTDEDKDFIATLKDFSATGNNKEKAIDIMHTIVDEGEKVMIALKKRVAAGAMVKPSEQKMLGQMEKYKKIDVLKGQKELEAKAQKQIEQKNEDYMPEPSGSSVYEYNRKQIEKEKKRRKKLSLKKRQEAEQNDKIKLREMAERIAYKEGFSK